MNYTGAHYDVQVAARRLFDLVDRKPLIEEPLKPAGKPESFNWKLEAVSLQYEVASQHALEHINLVPRHISFDRFYSSTYKMARLKPHILKEAASLDVRL